MGAAWRHYFLFCEEGIESALAKARGIAAGKDIRIAGGANAIQQFLNAGLVDEFTIHYSPVLFGEGTPLFWKINDNIKIRIKNTLVSKDVTHVTYEVEK